MRTQGFGPKRVVDRTPDIDQQGLSNKDIARRLVLSVRTVEGHIYRACEKLALSHRSDLAKLVQV